VEDHRGWAAARDRASKRRSLPEDVRLADELLERAGPKPLREWGISCRPLGHRIAEEITHGRSMLGGVSDADDQWCEA
jgi:hypothetical protein